MKGLASCGIGKGLFRGNCARSQMMLKMRRKKMKKLVWLVVVVAVLGLNFASSCEPPKDPPKKKCVDSDGDLVCNANDGCPSDILKIDPGQCGCGNLETDSDSDGTADCIDGCPTDGLKIAPGQCGCGNPDTDSDSDGTANCLDGCPTDVAKIDPGQCGCGHPDTDGDGDGTANCVDGCPADPGKIVPGVCGCGVPDIDSDSDGTLNCLDGCPNDPGKVVPGVCGCGIDDNDSDSDGTPNCHDGCIYDPLKTEPGLCGCGIVDDSTDTDGDGTVDCTDWCDYDPDKVVPGICGCNYPDDIDFSGDGKIDCGGYYLDPYAISLPSGLVATVLADADWYRNDTSIALDSQKNLHVLYRGMKLTSYGDYYCYFTYANNIGSVWKGGSPGIASGTYNSMVLGSNNKVHIAATRYYINEKLVYITNKSGDWLTEVVDGASSVGLENDIILDPQGKAHISYWQWYGAQARYVNNISGQWNVTDLGFGNWRPAPILADSNNKIHLFWTWSESWVENNIYLGQQYFINEYTNASGSWAINIIWYEKSQTIKHFKASAVLGQNNTIFMINDQGLFTIQGATLQQDIFQQMAVPFNTQDVHIDEDSLAIDANNKLHFAFVVWDNHDHIQLYYASNVFGAWKYKLVEQWPFTSTRSEIDVVFPPGITIDADGKAYIIYVNTEDLTVRYIKFNPQTFLSAP